jgi:hypothetical protein
VIYWGSNPAGPVTLRLLGIAAFFVCMSMMGNAILQAVGQEKLPIVSIVAGGVVKIAAVDAVNGLDVVVADASSQIVLDLSSEDADFASYGIRNTKTDSPFAADGAANITIRLNADEPPATRFERGILTVKSAAYPSVDAAVKIAKSAVLDGWTVTRTPRDNGDGTTTMVVAVKIGGTRILLR